MTVNSPTLAHAQRIPLKMGRPPWNHIGQDTFPQSYRSTGICLRLQVCPDSLVSHAEKSACRGQRDHCGSTAVPGGNLEDDGNVVFRRQYASRERHQASDGGQSSVPRVAGRAAFIDSERGEGAQNLWAFEDLDRSPTTASIAAKFRETFFFASASLERARRYAFRFALHALGGACPGKNGCASLDAQQFAPKTVAKFRWGGTLAVRPMKVCHADIP